MNDLSLMTARELGKYIKGKQLSPVELTKHMLQRIRQMDGTLRTYITPLEELAIIQAKDAENKIMKGEYLGPLHGIGVGIKDNKFTKGIRTTDGSKLFADFFPSESATVVNKLLHGGVIMLGKQNMHELAAGSTGTNPFFGTTRNPWNLEYMPGGSSGGGTASLAAGLATLATGSDTFGSIRLPASMCGVYGLKPTYGLVSTFRVFPSAWSLDTVGPMARSVGDLAIMLQVMAGYDPNDPAILRVPLPNYSEAIHNDIKGIKIGIPTYYVKGLDEDIAMLFRRAVVQLQYLGAEVKELEIPELEMSTFSGYLTVGSEAAAFHNEWLKTHPEDYSPDIRSFFLAGSLMEGRKYVQAQQARRRMVQAFEKAFQEVDMLLGPTIPIKTPKFQANWVKQNLDVVKRTLPFTVPVNLTGVPALAVPMGIDSNGLPAGMQFIGRHLSEQQLLQVGNAWEQLNPLQFKLRAETDNKTL
ncbi:amidase family protein [Oceanobacillus luteolus]|uniref:Amidase n=1 Tax=Oceanobacillus luteolus TaxID=1274358 RepID=A0ABW4HP22_9BACI|nr:amidase [Oceanobacillus luteolus]MCM3739477.1 amidase family protein [Oceanobacillus luteolus]